MKCTPPPPTASGLLPVKGISFGIKLMVNSQYIITGSQISLTCRRPLSETEGTFDEHTSTVAYGSVAVPRRCRKQTFSPSCRSTPTARCLQCGGSKGRGVSGQVSCSRRSGRLNEADPCTICPCQYAMRNPNCRTSHPCSRKKSPD